jgi:hypothetical protein
VTSKMTTSSFHPTPKKSMKFHFLSFRDLYVDFYNLNSESWVTRFYYSCTK